MSCKYHDLVYKLKALPGFSSYSYGGAFEEIQVKPSTSKVNIPYTLGIHPRNNDLIVVY